MRYAIGAAIGAVLALLLGVPSFSVDRYTESEPPLFSTYCDLERTARERECVPSGGGTMAMVLLGAAIGAVGAAALRRRTSTSDRDAAGRASASEQSDAHAPASTAEDKQKQQEQDDARDEVILEAALEISAAVDKRSDQTIRRKDASTYISDAVRGRGSHLGIINLAGTAVDRAIDIGVLRTIGAPGPEGLIARTSRPLVPTSGLDSHDDALASHAESTQEGSADPSRDAGAPADQPSETSRAAPELLEELESLIRLHERGILTDAELEAAKARLINKDDG